MSDNGSDSRECRSRRERGISAYAATFAVPEQEVPERHGRTPASPDANAAWPSSPPSPPRGYPETT